jgi:soluble lytic murein transglycosylase-like protein
MIQLKTIRIAALTGSALALALVALVSAQAQTAFFGLPSFPGPTDKQNWFGMARTPQAEQQNTRQRGAARDTQARAHYSSAVARHAAANGLPPELVHSVIMRESRYNPRAVSKGNYGMMQIRLGTARAMGYTGSAAGLLDPETNMQYAVRYLAGAYRAAGGNQSRAVALYASGYYYRAKRQGFSPYTGGPVGRGMQLAQAMPAATTGTAGDARPAARPAQASVSSAASADSAAAPAASLSSAPRDAAINTQLIRDAVPQ